MAMRECAGQSEITSDVDIVIFLDTEMKFLYLKMKEVFFAV
jgi:hypothetical protein